MASVEMSTTSTSTRESVTASQAAEGMEVLKSLLKPPEIVTATKLKPVLEKQICYFSGAKHKGFPILTFPSTGLTHLDEEEGFKEMHSSVSYFMSMIKPEDVEKGVVVLVDCRKTKQAQTIKNLVEKIASQEFPLPVQELYLLKYSQFFSKSGLVSLIKTGSRPRSLASAEVKQKLTVVSVKDKDELYQKIPQECLTAEFGGSLEYSHQDWLANTTMYERIEQLREQILSRLPDVRDGLNEFEVPQSVKDAERLLQQHLKLKEFFINLFAEIDVLMDQLTTRLLAKQEAAASLSVATVALLSTPSVMEYLNRTNEDVREEQAEFDKFWVMHKARLDHIMRTCHFYRSVIKVQNLMDSHNEDLTGSVVVIGGTLEEAFELGDRHDKYVTGCKDSMEKHLTELKEEGQQLSKSPTSDPVAMTAAMKKAVDEITKKIQMLTEQQHEFMTLCQQKRDFFIVAIKYHMTVKQCDQWCHSVKELTETPPTPETTSVQHAGSLISQTDAVMKQMAQRQLNTLKELASCLPEKQVKKMTQKTIQKCTNSRLKLEDHKSKLLQLVALSYKPPQPPDHHVTDSISSIGSTSSVDHPHPSTSSLASSHSYGSLTGSDQADAPSSISPQLAGYVDEESDPAVLRNRQHVYKEMVDTETVFIDDLKIILDSYYYEMEPEERIPLRLRGKKGIIFGNLKEIYEFHSQGFLAELQLFSDHPERVGQCFLRFKSEFLLYEEYIKNRANSEALLCESPECQFFFKEIQIRLAHPLALNSFLIKPIQRITKYQLLLKDMIKRSSKAGQGLTDLKNALDLMLKLLKSINDSLHVVGLRGFPGTLAEQGRLLIHDPFQVWETTGHSRSLLSRSKERYVFLYEKVIVFSKKKEEVVQQKNREKKSDSYVYKAHLQLADVHLKESCDDGPQVFVLSIHGENKMMYRLQAASKGVKDMWVSEVKRLLSGQFALLKDLLIRSGTLDRETAKKYRSSNGASKTKMSDPIAIKTNGAAPGEKKSFSERFWFLKKKQRAQSGPSTNSLEAPRRRSHDIAAGVRHISPSPTHQSSRLKGVMEGGASPSQSLPVTRLKPHKSTDDLRAAAEGEEWSDDDEPSDHEQEHEFYESLAPSVPRHYVAIAEYTPSNDDQGLPLKMNQEVEVLGLNQYTGWWLVRIQDYRTGEPATGWVPASYLRTAKDQTNMPL